MRCYEVVRVRGWKKVSVMLHMLFFLAKVILGPEL